MKKKQDTCDDPQGSASSKVPNGLEVYKEFALLFLLRKTQCKSSEKNEESSYSALGFREVHKVESLKNQTDGPNTYYLLCDFDQSCIFLCLWGFEGKGILGHT